MKIVHEIMSSSVATTAPRMPNGMGSRITVARVGQSAATTVLIRRPSSRMRSTNSSE